MSLSELLQEAAAARRGEPKRREEPAERPASVDAGIPAPCPACGGPGFLDEIDVRRHQQHEHCLACRAAWTRPI